MGKEQPIEVEGVVTEVLPGTKFKVTLKDNHTMQILVDTTEDLTLEQALFGEKAEFFEELYSILPVLKAKRM